MDVLVVGAGPVGLSAALELRRGGAKPTIIEKREGASEFSRAVGILPHSMRLWEESGVADVIAREAVGVCGARVFENGMERVHLNIKGRDHKYPHIYSLPQDQTERILIQHLAALGVRVKYNHCFEELDEGDHSIRAKINGVWQEFDYLIGADGVKSTMREALGIQWVGHGLQESWSIIDGWAPDWRFVENFTLWLSAREGAAAVVPLGGGRYRLVGQGEHPIDDYEIPIHFSRIFRQGSFQISIKQVKTYQKGRAFLAGDAAHCHSPVGGRGMNLGVDDACELAQRMLSGELEGYTASRHKTGRKVIARTERARKFFAEGGSLPRLAFFSILGNLPPQIRQKIASNWVLK